MSWPAALDPRSPEAGAVSWLFWSFTGLCTVIWVLVVLAVLIGLIRRHRQRPDPIAVSRTEERRVHWVIGSLAVLTGVIVAGLTVISFAGQQRIFGLTNPAVEIQVIGHQWWWEVRYPDPNADASKLVTTANELHVPVGQLVHLTLTSTDVIHSFWVPSLMGKADLIPGRSNSLSFTAEKEGIYAGQCAEFCGLQHAHMGIRVIAENPDAFASWKAAQAAPAPEAQGDTSQAGQQAFLSNPCVSCHAIRGTAAGGAFGPDLTHVASRTTIAAGTAPLNRGTLAAWITDPQGMKPGTNMPVVKLSPDDLNNLVDYLMELK